jgi:hypothetical protein
MERKNHLHSFPFTHEIEADFEESTSSDKNLCKKYVRKVDAAITFCPESNNIDKDFKLYLLICEAKTPDCIYNNDYDKLIRSMHDSYNSIIIYYSRKAEKITKDLIDLFQKVLIYGIQIHGK